MIFHAIGNKYYEALQTPLHFRKGTLFLTTTLSKNFDTFPTTTALFRKKTSASRSHKVFVYQTGLLQHFLNTQHHTNLLRPQNMASQKNSESVAPGEQTATAFPNSAANTKPKISLSNRRKASELDINKDPALKSNDAEKDASAPAEMSRKNARVLKPKLDPENLMNENSMNEQEGMGMFDSATPDMRRKRNQKKAISVVQHLQATSEIVAATHVTSGTSPTETVIPPKKARKKAEPKKIKPAQQDPAKWDSPNGQDAVQAVEASAGTSRKRKADTPNMEGGSPKDSVTESDAPPEKKPKRVPPRAKKASARKIAADKDGKKKKEDMPPPPLPPAPISKEVANKVTQVRQFIDNEEEKNSELDRDLENKQLISVPESSLISAVIRMRAHYEMSQPLEAALSDVEDAVVQRFRPAIELRSDIDWVTIDALKRTKFENGILQKIARHGLDDVNLLEIELEMFKKDHLKRFGEYDDKKEVAWDADRFLRTFAQIWDGVTSEKKGTDLKDGDESERLDAPTPQKEEEVGRIGICVAPIQPV